MVLQAKTTSRKDAFKQFIQFHHKNSKQFTPKEEKSGLLIIIHIYKQPHLEHSKY